MVLLMRAFIRLLCFNHHRINDWSKTVKPSSSLACHFQGMAQARDCNIAPTISEMIWVLLDFNRIEWIREIKKQTSFQFLSILSSPSTDFLRFQHFSVMKMLWILKSALSTWYLKSLLVLKVIFVYPDGGWMFLLFFLFCLVCQHLANSSHCRIRHFECKENEP